MVTEIKKKHLKIPFNTRLNSSIYSELLKSLIKHLLFMRGQIPCTFNELERLVSEWLEKERNTESHKKKLQAGPMKRAVKLVKAVNLFFQDFDVLFNQYQVQKIVIVLGSSINTPIEIITVHFYQYERNEVESDDSFDELSPKECSLYLRKLIRAMIMCDSSMFGSRPMNSTGIHFAAFLNHDDQMEKPLSLAHFTPKQTFKLREPKRSGSGSSRDVHIYLEPINAVEDNCDGSLWYQSKIHLNGFDGPL